MSTKNDGIEEAVSYLIGLAERLTDDDDNLLPENAKLIEEHNDRLAYLAYGLESARAAMGPTGLRASVDIIFLFGFEIGRDDKRLDAFRDAMEEIENAEDSD